MFGRRTSSGRMMITELGACFLGVLRVFLFFFFVSFFRVFWSLRRFCCTVVMSAVVVNTTVSWMAYVTWTYLLCVIVWYGLSPHETRRPSIDSSDISYGHIAQTSTQRYHRCHPASTAIIMRPCIHTSRSDFTILNVE